jgi:hypothetical protein
MRNQFTKSIKLILLLSLLTPNLLLSKDFYWSSYKKTLNLENQNDSKQRDLEQYAKAQYGVNISRDMKTLAEKEEERTSLNSDVGFIMRQSKEYLNDSLGIEEKTRSLGVYMSALFDLGTIGVPLRQTYSTMYVFEDMINLTMGKKIQSTQKGGFFFETYGGVFFQLKNTFVDEGLYLNTGLNLGWNFEKWVLRVGGYLPIENIKTENINYYISMGMRL